MGRTYTSMRGKEIDMEKMSMRFEKTPAVGNMKVNARGDRLDSENKTIDLKSKQLKRSNDRQVISNVSSSPVTTKSTLKEPVVRTRGLEQTQDKSDVSDEEN